MLDQLSAEIVPSLTKGRPNNNKAKCIPGGTVGVLAGKNASFTFAFLKRANQGQRAALVIHKNGSGASKRNSSETKLVANPQKTKFLLFRGMHHKK
jgi:hypothetical protein